MTDPARLRTLAAKIDPDEYVGSPTGWTLRATQHYAAAVRQHASGNVPGEFTKTEISLAYLALEIAKG
jgi:hypothetical protein